MRNLAYVGYEPLVKVQYDYDKLMRCLLPGENRGAFIRRLNIVLQGTDDAWQRICRSSDPTVQLELIMRSIRIAGAMFVKDAQDPDAEITHLRRLMKHQLIHRRRLRQWFVGTADTLSVLPDSFNQYISFPMRHGLHQWFFTDTRLNRCIAVLRAWQVYIVLDKCNRSIDKYNNGINVANKSILCDQLESEIHSGQSSRIYHLCRTIAKAKKGARRRWRGATSTSFPGRAALWAKVQRPAKSGGW